ncbi:DNA polymerase alpha catalytic subunit-like [Pogonomyrmex barbatus]|uniref:DNA-directed DNA polymerase n=1 Tax=Pogonomyrmex barbatus TaxID=144034 RepID=A0A6I9W132_9HYME|nr:DNA polymerase alpha catalytic subunit-like [Pogonomyrmex barbatus]
MMLHLAALGGHYKQLNAGRFSKTRNTIYGDTDSLMINTNILEYDDVFSIGRKIMRKINNRYKKVEFDGDIDGVFRYLLLLQKKNMLRLQCRNCQTVRYSWHKNIKVSIL